MARLLTSGGRDLVGDVRRFVAGEVHAYLRTPGADQVYPSALVQRMRELGLFGANVPAAFGGLALSPENLLAIHVELGKGWLSLAVLLGMHLRACSYVVHCGTAEQQALYLPAMASGDCITALAPEPWINDPGEVWPRLVHDKGGHYKLCGRSRMVANAKDADAILCIARRPEDGQEESEQADRVAVTVFPGRQGVTIAPDRPRFGLRSTSLCDVEMADYHVLPFMVVGGPEADIAEISAADEVGSSLSYVAWAVGTAHAVVEYCVQQVAYRAQPVPGPDTMGDRFAVLMTRVYAMEACLQFAASAPPARSERAHMAKVYCTEALELVIRDAFVGIAGPAGDPRSLNHLMADAVTLDLVAPPNHVLLNRIKGQALAGLGSPIQAPDPGPRPEGENDDG